MIFEKNSPIFIFPSSLTDFNSYFKSLSKSAKKGLNLTIKKNVDIEYTEIPLEFEILEKFMNLWTSQPLANGQYPLWGEWNPNFLINLSSEIEIVLFGSYLNSELISIQFVFRWGNYIYCNAPLYDKSLHKKREISKYMWLKLIEWSISKKIDYLDLMGSTINETWSSVIKNRVGSNDQGDFGYKWKFIPNDIKNDPNPTSDLRINSCEECNMKWVENLSSPKKCKCDDDNNLTDSACSLLIIAHPDDEIIFFGNYLSNNKTDVICICSSNDPIRKEEFHKSMEYYKISNFQIWEFESKLKPFTDIEKQIIKNRLSNLKYDKNKIVTHSRYGEYGHIQHIDIHDIVVETFNNDSIYVYDLGNYVPNNKMDVISKIYQSQYNGILEISNSECTGSDWYKHTIDNNLMDYENIIPYNKEYGDIHIEFIGNFYTDIKENIINGLTNRGLKVTETEGEFIIILQDILDMSESELESLKTKINRSKRTIVTSKYVRNFIGNALNIVSINFSENDFNTSVKIIESHILMGDRFSEINKLDNRFSNISLINNKLEMVYNGDDTIHSIIKMYDNTGRFIIRYDLLLEKNGNYFFILPDNLINKPIFIRVFDLKESLIFSQNIK